MDHQSSCNTGGIDRAPRCASADLGFVLCEQRLAVSAPGIGIRRRQDSHHFAEHPAVCPELNPVLQMLPDRSSAGDRVDAAKYRVPGRLFETEPVLNRLNLN